MSSHLLIFALFAAAVFFSFLLFFALRIAGDRLIFEKKSRYHHIMVYENGDIRTLRLGKGPDDGKQSRVDLRDPQWLLLEYTRLMFAGLLIKEKPLKVLVIGLGGGVLPMALNHYIPEAEIDVVDIDPDVVETAQKYFMFLPGENTKVHIADARSFILDVGRNDPGKKYDMIMLDAFNSCSIPRHLTTEEFLNELMQVLDPEGVVSANILIDNRLFHSIIKTYRKAFKKSYLFMGGQAQNSVIVSAGPKAPSLSLKKAEIKAESLQGRYHFRFSMLSVARQLRPDYSPKMSAKVLSDNQNS